MKSTIKTTYFGEFGIILFVPICLTKQKRKTPLSEIKLKENFST